MIKITITPPNQFPFSKEFLTVSDAFDFLEILQAFGYAGARQEVTKCRHGKQSDCELCIKDKQ